MNFFKKLFSEQPSQITALSKGITIEASNHTGMSSSIKTDTNGRPMAVLEWATPFYEFNADFQYHNLGKEYTFSQFLDYWGWFMNTFHLIDFGNHPGNETLEFARVAFLKLRSLCQAFTGYKLDSFADASKRFAGIDPLLKPILERFYQSAKVRLEYLYEMYPEQRQFHMEDGTVETEGRIVRDSTVQSLLQRRYHLSNSDYKSPFGLKGFYSAGALNIIHTNCIKPALNLLDALLETVLATTPGKSFTISELIDQYELPINDPYLMEVSFW